ncbi:MAG TPA: hypothetical protein VNV66_07235 [Pilimelia sp.]|nr:hypothetical protein [Pilimelia sp.]
MWDDRTAADTAWPAALGLLLVDQEPAIFALYRREEGQETGHIVAWVAVIPDGDAFLVWADSPGTRPVLTTLANVRRRWTDLLDAELVQVAGPGRLRLAG